MEYIPSPHRIAKSIDEYFDKAHDSVVFTEESDPARVFYLRPSSFPYCGLKFFLDFPRRLEEPRLATLSSTYYTEVGTVTHSVFQRYGGSLGKIVGDWYCPKCKKIVSRFTTHTTCKCGTELRYEELEVAYKKTVLGHTDGLFRFTPKDKVKSSHAVLDYKTTSMRAIKEDEELREKNKKPKFPYRGNKAQIQTYVPLLEAQYGISVDYWILIYLARDSPFKWGRKVVVKYLTKKDKERLRKSLDRTVKVHRKVLKAETYEDVALIRKYKLCKSLEDYNTNWKDEYNDCPFLAECFTDKLMDKKIKQTLKAGEFPIIMHAPKKIRKAMEL